MIRRKGSTVRRTVDRVRAGKPVMPASNPADLCNKVNQANSLNEVNAADDRFSQRPYEEAVRLLTRRMHSVAEIREKLGQKGYAKDQVEEAVRRLQSRGLLDDEVFAAQWVEQRHRLRHYGPVRLRLELKGKGVEPDLIEQVLAETFADQETMRDQMLVIAQKAISRWNHYDRTTKARRLSAYLQRRGYPQEWVRYAVEHCLTYFRDDD